MTTILASVPSQHACAGQGSADPLAGFISLPDGRLDFSQMVRAPPGASFCSQRCLRRFVAAPQEYGSA
jgi:hypothetical protein